MDKALQENRYKHFEEKRNRKIKMISEKRSELANNLKQGVSKIL
jgi:hypothetical protein